VWRGVPRSARVNGNAIADVCDVTVNETFSRSAASNDVTARMIARERRAQKTEERDIGVLIARPTSLTNRPRVSRPTWLSRSYRFDSVGPNSVIR
jgi:hypothetical protein